MIYGTFATCVQPPLTADVMRHAAQLIESAMPMPNMRIIESDKLIDRYQFRFPRCKSKRIRRKWAKIAGNFKERPSSKVFMTSQGMVCHTDMARAMREALGVMENKHPELGIFRMLWGWP